MTDAAFLLTFCCCFLLCDFHFRVSQYLSVESVSLLEDLCDEAVLVPVHGAQGLVELGIELPLRGDLLEAVRLEDLYQVRPDPADPLHELGLIARVLQRAVQVVDDRQEVPDDGGAGVLAELLVLALRSLAEVVEVRLQPAGHVQVLVRLDLGLLKLLLETDLRLLHIFRLISHW